jgi:hypothetical protein
MLLVVQTMGRLGRIYGTQTDLAASSAAASLALDDILFVLSLAGQGLGDGPASVLPRIRDAKPSESTLTLRSNPDVDAGLLQADLVASGQDVAIAPSDAFEEGDSALLTDAAGFGETAEVVRADPIGVALRSLETGAFAAPSRRAAARESWACARSDTSSTLLARTGPGI